MKISRNTSQKYYEKTYLDKKTIATNEKGVQIARRALSEIDFRPNRRVLDVACGTGLLGKVFSDSVWGFDSSSEAVRIAKSIGIVATIGDVENTWKYPNDYFDMVIASHIIEHVRNPDALLSEARRVLKKNGVLIIITPNLAAWFNRILLLIGYQPFFTEVSTLDKTLGLGFTKRISANSNPVGHLRVFTLPALVDLLILHNWRITKTVGVEFGAFPRYFQLLDRLLSKYTPMAASLIVVAQKKR